MVKKVWGVGLTAETESGKSLDTWYPNIYEGDVDEAKAKELTAKLAHLEGKDDARLIINKVITVSADLEDDVQSAPDGYLRLHALSWRMVKPNTLSLEGLFDKLNLVAWTSRGACDYENFEETRLRLMAKYGIGANIRCVDRIPRMTTYVTPDGVRIANTENVRLGAYLHPGTEIGYTGFVNYNAGTLGAARIEGRVSQGVTVDEGTTLAGGASTAGTLSVGIHKRVSLGKDCHMGANSGLAVPLGDDCVVEGGLYLNSDTKVYYMPSGGVMPGDTGFFIEPKTMLAEELAGVSHAVFRRNSQTGRVEAVSRGGTAIEFSD